LEGGVGGRDAGEVEAGRSVAWGSSKGLGWRDFQRVCRKVRGWRRSGGQLVYMLRCERKSVAWRPESWRAS